MDNVVIDFLSKMRRQLQAATDRSTGRLNHSKLWSDSSKHDYEIAQPHHSAGRIRTLSTELATSRVGGC